jgi:hypothetical protein
MLVVHVSTLNKTYLFLVLTTVEPLVYAQFYQQQNLFFLFIIILEPLF